VINSDEKKKDGNEGKAKVVFMAKLYAKENKA
jgi:hypothetical protein